MLRILMIAWPEMERLVEIGSSPFIFRLGSRAELGRLFPAPTTPAGA
jgi:hypothetical protein